MAVIDAFDNNIQDLLNENKKVVIKFYAGWCGSCRLFKPKYRRLSEDERFSNVAFLDIDAEQNPEIRKKAGVNNLPFFAVFKDGELVDAKTTAKEDAVVEMIQKIL
ncbi:thioredoxin family protein [Sediminitomix flava]|uniref:Thioredoxin n=1 Tax=Sediminitomix flava TaxID=379075 RepID=A0A315Z9F6_SEDFL|nr:thioredoxin family protein [Sediminitomix flava]PWJ42195.1 thioredoxin [Sediminitomix flava]